MAPDSSITRLIKKKVAQLKCYFFLYPALRYALLLLSVALYSIPYTLFFLITCFQKKERLRALILSLLYASLHPPLEKVPMPSSFHHGIVKIHTISKKPTAIGIRTIGRGTLQEADGQQMAHPVTISFPYKPPKHTVLEIENGRLFYSHLKGKIVKTQGSTLPQTKYTAKQKVCEYIEQYYPSPLSRSLLQSTIGATPSSFLLIHLFKKAGLSHLLAISGFHYAFLITLATFIIPWWLPKAVRSTILCMFLVLSLFYFDTTPSVIRAFLMTLFALIGVSLKRKPTGTNMLGVAMLITILFDSESIHSIAFQLSHAACFAILLIVPLYKTLFVRILFRYSPEERSLFSTKEKGILLLLYWALAIPVIATVAFIATAPLILTYFSTIPLFSFLYNLFFPLLLTFSFFLFTLSIFAPPLHLVNDQILSLFLSALETTHPILHTHLNYPLSPESACFSLVLLFTLLITSGQKDLHIDKYPRDLVYS